MMKLVLLALALTVAVESASLADTIIPESEPEQMDQITDPSAAENEEHCIECIGAG